jgi:hypothetical protein
VTVHLLYRRVEPQIQTIAEPGEQGANVLPGTAGHHVPLRAIANIQQAVVFKEAQNSGSGKRRISCSDDDQMAAPIGRI